MQINKNKLTEVLEKIDRTSLQELLLQAFDRLDNKGRSDAFGDFYYEHIFKKMTGEERLAGIRDFEKRSLKGDFYDHKWEWNSKTYDEVTPITQLWYDEMSYWLDITCETALQGNASLARQCFRILLNMLDDLHDDQIIVCHHDVGAENLYCRFDYKRIYEGITLSS